MPLIKQLRKSLAYFLLALAFTVATATQAFAATIEKGYVTLENGERVYRVQVKGTSAAAPIVLINGIVYSLEKWNAVLEDLARSELNAMIYALPGQSENLVGLRASETPESLRRGFTLADLASHLEQVLRATGYSSKKVILVGTSYGTAPAVEFASTRPNQVAELVLGAPLVVPLDRYDQTGAMLNQSLEALRAWEDLAQATLNFWLPWAWLPVPRSSEMIKDQMGQALLDKLVTASPPGVELELFKRGIFNLMKAVDNFNLHSYSDRITNVHQVMATGEVRAAADDQYTFWTNLPKKSRRSLLVIDDSHMLPEASPRTVAQWLSAIAARNPVTKAGRAFFVKGEKRPVETPYKPGEGGGENTMPMSQGPAMGPSEKLGAEIARMPEITLF